MDIVKLRRAGGSLVLTIPSTLVRSLKLEEGGRVAVSAADGRIVAEPQAAAPRRYRLEDLLAQCDAAAPLSAEDETWLSLDDVGDERA
jgi:antitoxin ChpS